MAFADAGLLGDLLGDTEVAAHLTPEAEISAMLAFEAALARVEARLEIIPADAGPVITSALSEIRIAPADLVGPTAAAGVSVPGLVKLLRSEVGAPFGGYIHWGATSQDATDTGFVLRMRVVIDILQSRLTEVCGMLSARAEENAAVQMAARTRSQVATPTSFGLRIAGWRAPLVRCLDRLEALKPRLMRVQLGGAAGTLSVLGDTAVAALEGLARELDLLVPEKPWHTERDAIVELSNWLAMVSGLLGRIGGDLILMGRSEAAEAKAGTGGGSSTMPHKSNPVLAEALVTLARLNGGFAGQMQQVLLHHEERDGPPWITEWVILPQMLVAAAAGLRHAQVLAETLEPVPENMARAMETGGGAMHAEALAFALAQQMPLGDAQAIVKQAAQASGGNLVERVAALCRDMGHQPPDLQATDIGEIAAVWIRRSIGR
ncbi:MAG: lyase family protein [Pseudomonadota bacterium]